MSEFKREIQDCITVLRAKYRASRTCIIENYPILEIVRFHHDKEVSEKLVYDPETGLFEITPPSLQYYSKISHYDFKRAEKRWVRNKDLLFSLIRDLKFSGLWDYITNRDFLVVNTHNQRSDAKELKTTLKKMVK